MDSLELGTPSEFGSDYSCYRAIEIGSAQCRPHVFLIEEIFIFPICASPFLKHLSIHRLDNSIQKIYAHILFNMMGCIPGLGVEIS